MLVSSKIFTSLSYTFILCRGIDRIMSDLEKQQHTKDGTAFSLEFYRQHYARLIKGHTPPFEDQERQSRREAEEFSEHGLISTGAKVLDIGCGHGRQAIGMMEFGVGSYTGLDVIPESIEFCKTVFAAVPNFEFLHLDVKNDFYNPQGRQLPREVVFPVESGTYDAVIAGSLYTHLVNKKVCDHYLEESYRALRPGGGIFCSWFRSPPNEVSNDPVRTVLTERAILDIVSKRFHIYFSRGGTSDDFNDQWCLYGRKKG